MAEFLRDPIWQSIGAIIAILAIIISVYIFLLQRNKKTLAYDVLLNVPLLTKKEGLEGRIKIRFDDNYVENIHLIALKVSNEGNIPILPTDFVEHLRFTLGEANRVLGAEVSSLTPPELSPKITTKGSTIEVEPLLLNSGDSFLIKLLLTKPGTNIQANARIVGVSKIQILTGRNKYSRRSDFGFLLMSLAGIGCIVLGTVLNKLTPPEYKALQTQLFFQYLPWIILLIIVVLIGISLTAFSLIGQSRFNKSHYSIPESFKSQKGSSSDW